MFAAVLFMSASGTVSDQRSQLESVESAITSLPVSTQPAVASGAIAQERTDRVAALAAALSTRTPVDRLLRELAFVLPEDAWLTGLTASAPVSASPAATPPGTAPSAAGAAPGVTIEGATYSHESVARVLARLAALPTLADVRLTASSRVDRGPEQRGCNYHGEDEEAEAGGDVHHHREHPPSRCGMRARLASLPPRALLAIGVGAVLLYAMVVWFLLVSPKRAEATTLSEDVVAAELRLAEARATASRPTRPTGTRVSDVLRLAKAMPASTDQPGLLLELELLGRATGVELGSITLQDPVLNVEVRRRYQSSSRSTGRIVRSPGSCGEHGSSCACGVARFARRDASSRCRQWRSPSRRHTAFRASTRQSRSTRSSTTDRSSP